MHCGKGKKSKYVPLTFPPIHDASFWGFIAIRIKVRICLYHCVAKCSTLWNKRYTNFNLYSIFLQCYIACRNFWLMMKYTSNCYTNISNKIGPCLRYGLLTHKLKGCKMQCVSYKCTVHVCTQWRHGRSWDETKYSSVLYCLLWLYTIGHRQSTYSHYCSWKSFWNGVPRSHNLL